MMGSATPSMESFQHARSERYQLLRLGGRVLERPLPTVRYIDMREEFGRSNELKPVSDELAAELRACIDRGDQALVLRNRRGWAAAVFCPTCGGRVACRNCSVTMTWHQLGPTPALPLLRQRRGLPRELSDLRLRGAEASG